MASDRAQAIRVLVPRVNFTTFCPVHSPTDQSGPGCTEKAVHSRIRGIRQWPGTHTPTKVDLGEVRTQPPHAVDVNDALQPPLQIVTESLPEDDKSPSLEEQTFDASTIGHQDHNVDPLSPHNPIKNGLIIMDPNQLDPEPLSIISSPQGPSKDIQLRPAPHPSKKLKTWP
ncbi:hypothetical protein P167DRAFT_574291 [Morchella conica CCBAS932]|uniref:Uncharacterized protein n=1 Tax=Morchella conica CCBAS932 TaxID=1392247 RepID=A0A3N4KPT6_9PEZI|nr:hypothetical protein P167DRAFT_574291 [Morchella conica CCBAS932]